MLLSNGDITRLSPPKIFLGGPASTRFNKERVALTNIQHGESEALVMEAAPIKIKQVWVSHQKNENKYG